MGSAFQLPYPYKILLIRLPTISKLYFCVRAFFFSIRIIINKRDREHVDFVLLHFHDVFSKAELVWEIKQKPIEHDVYDMIRNHNLFYA